MNNNLNNAKINKNDEFYTYYKDIENVIELIKDNLKDKIIYCNCDDYRWSNFYKYFKDNFDYLKLKELRSSNYSRDNNSYYVKYTGSDEIITKLDNGSFDSDECVEILKESDIIITNPPFSLKVKFFNLINQYGKDYCILLPILNFHYKTDKMHYIYNNIRIFFDEKGNNLVATECVWLNSFIDKPLKSIELSEFDNNKQYQYDDLDGYLVVDKTKDIPSNYIGYIYVPSTIFRYNINIKYEFIKYSRIKVNDKYKFVRILIKV